MTDDEILGGQCVNAMASIARQFDRTKAESARGSVECPRCHGTLQYTATKPGRRLVIRAKCETPACLEFMT